MGSGGKVYSIADAQEFARKGMAAQADVDKLIQNNTSAGAVVPIGRGKDARAQAGADGATGIRSAKQPNKTEAEFGRILQARIDKGELRGPLKFEAVKLRIGGNCYYTPDWMCFTPFGSEGQWWPIFFEVKGPHIWDDSKVKFKAAIEQHAWAFFDMWQKKAGEWRRIH